METCDKIKKDEQKDNNDAKDDNGSMAARLSLAAGVLLMLLAGATEARDPNNPYSCFNMFLRNLEIMTQRIKEEMDDYYAPVDVISMYYTHALLALGSKHETRSELLHTLNYLSIDYIKGGASLLNKTIPTYSQYSFQSYIDLSEKAELDSEFDRIVTQYIPFVEKRQSKKLCELCDLPEPALTETQQVCFSSYTDYKADWATPFDPQQTSKGSFKSYSGSVVDRSMITRTGLALYKEDKDQFNMQMLTLPFASLDSVLILMKPNNWTDFDTLGESVYSDFENLVKDVIYQQAPTNVKIRLPKYQYTEKTYVLESPSFTDRETKIWAEGAQTAILKKYPDTYMQHFDYNITLEINEEGINYQADTVVGNVDCEGIPERKIPTLKKSDVQSPFAVPEIVNLVAGIANETLKPASETVVEFSGDEPFLYMILTTDLTVLATGTFYGI